MLLFWSCPFLKGWPQLLPEQSTWPGAYRAPHPNYFGTAATYSDAAATYSDAAATYSDAAATFMMGKPKLKLTQLSRAGAKLDKSKPNSVAP